ncbi:MAG: class I SAM-dependent methyltransferase [Deltaproteobacteria bacterium]|nr:class I SAM-dependent methyltransferase [Deltaproteobacteria bacterium]
MAISDSTKERARSLAQWSAAAEMWTGFADELEKINGVFTELLIAGAKLAPGQTVLDLASGPGDPALSIATKVSPGGRVVATDQSPEMVAGANERAARRGLENFEAQTTDAEELPFPDATFDRVTSRFGAMLFVDPIQGLSEALRVLKPGGRAAMLVWGQPERNAMFALIPRVLGKIIELPPPDPDAPSATRLGAEGALAEVFRAAGFDAVEETRKAVTMGWGRGPAETWGVLKRLMASLPPVLARLEEAQRRRLDEAMIEVLEGAVENGQVVLPAEVVLATGEKASGR